jgi:hypothetical protein
MTGSGRLSFFRPDMDVRERETGAAGFCLWGRGRSRAAGITKGVAEEHPLAWAGELISKLGGSVRGAEQPLCECLDTVGQF